jgi:hypothetical protein
MISPIEIMSISTVSMMKGMAARPLRRHVLSLDQRSIGMRSLRRRASDSSPAPPSLPAIPSRQSLGKQARQGLLFAFRKKKQKRPLSVWARRLRSPAEPFLPTAVSRRASPVAATPGQSGEAFLLLFSRKKKRLLSFWRL